MQCCHSQFHLQSCLNQPKSFWVIISALPFPRFFGFLHSLAKWPNSLQLKHFTFALSSLTKLLSSFVTFLVFPFFEEVLAESSLVKLSFPEPPSKHSHYFLHVSFISLIFIVKVCITRTLIQKELSSCPSFFLNHFLSFAPNCSLINLCLLILDH